eukprot:9055360-Pyramimonas_sp.AAC.1
MASCSRPGPLRNPWPMAHAGCMGPGLSSLMTHDAAVAVALCTMLPCCRSGIPLFPPCRHIQVHMNEDAMDCAWPVVL